MAPAVTRQIEASDLAWPQPENMTAKGRNIGGKPDLDGSSARGRCDRSRVEQRFHQEKCRVIAMAVQLSRVSNR